MVMEVVKSRLAVVPAEGADPNDEVNPVDEANPVDEVDPNEEAPEDGEIEDPDAPEDDEEDLPDDEQEDEGEEGEKILIGDLVDGSNTPEAQNIANLLLDNKNTKEENFEFISQELTEAFTEADGQCTRQSIRMGFHDAGTWSSKLAAAGQDYGGADGSLVFYGELTRPENFGLESAAGFAQQL
ncbi:uncharacterized protein K460DRAFT_351393 [Cucurbitaria berberidis CBS 394.84]|uniref:Peroxidase n=1 Tax=Cucurbitaria berberidis CBS 394.84 TaxID=1168544 RepID=A0A9P4GTJ8_9PLEO|nr:uncharacterized protein K460DRAFT_351393 [Cucurbitaria berberidis CBS 394.84]KAF1851475.1 hypothetical protein K460DRAFT_351393 [Cucurbitaria berberidis CBS 394.84]